MIMRALRLFLLSALICRAWTLAFKLSITPEASSLASRPERRASLLGSFFVDSISGRKGS